jgi:hypothetical protein
MASGKRATALAEGGARSVATTVDRVGRALIPKRTLRHSGRSASILAPRRRSRESVQSLLKAAGSQDP